MMTFLPSLLPQQRVLDEEGVLVAVADDQALRVRVDRQRGDQLRLAARLQPEVERRARVEDLLDDLAQLVDLDREHAAVDILVARFLDRRLERVVDASPRGAAADPGSG